MTLFKTPSLELDLPAPWRDGSICMLTAPKVDGFTASVVVTMEHDVIDQYLKGHVDVQLKTMREKMPSFVVTQRRPVVSDRFRYGEAVDFEWNSPEVGAPLHQHQLYALESGTLYTLTATALASHWPEQRAALEAVVASFKPRFFRPSD